jgi:AcrR family transcriptional regulator
MRDIAAELDMAVGNLYYYFRDKQELLAFVQEEALEALLALAERVIALPQHAEDRLAALIIGHVVLINESTPGSVAHLEVEALGEELRPAVQKQRDAYERRVRDLLEEGIADGRFRRVDAGMTARLLLGSLNWTARWFRPEGGRSAREVGVQAADFLLAGVLAPGVPMPPAGPAAPLTRSRQ